MKRFLFATSLLGAIGLGEAAFAQSPLDMNVPLVGKQAGTFMIRARAIGVLPEDSSSSVSKIGGTVSATSQAAPELDFSYFLTDNIALELIAATTRHEVSVKNSVVGPNLDVGSVWALPPALMLQYHFLPHAAFSPYVGVGVDATFWYGASAASPVTHFSVGTSFGPVIEAGIDYNFTGHWFANVDVKQIFYNTDAHVDALGTTVKAHTALNPLVVGAGIGYRF